jgi:dienelactone hydrolase
MIKFLILIVVALSGCASSVTNSGSLPISTFTTKLSTSGTVILLHGCGGPDSRQDKFANLLTENGFNAVVLDSWAYRGIPYGAGPNSVCSTYSVRARDRRDDELYKTVEWVKSQTWHKGSISVVGWSHGGMVALSAANNGPEYGITKAVSFYPYCLPNQFKNPKIKVQLHIGTNDDWTPATPCRNLYAESSNGKFFEYENSYHGFDGNVSTSVRGLGENGITMRTIQPNQSAKTLAYSRVIEFLKNE